MKTIKVIGNVDENHRLSAVVPAAVPVGQIEVVLTLPARQEDEAAAEWMALIAYAWADELRDPREDIYTLEDGEPIDGPR